MEYFEEPKQITEAMKTALARMFSDTDMREYLMNAMRIANSNAMSFLKVGKKDEAFIQSVKYDVLKQLLEKGKENFVNLEKHAKKGNQ